VNAPRLRAGSLVESFNFAFEGIIHVLRTQRNMRIHFVIAVAVLIAALATGVGKIELIALLLAIAFVLITEMINSAIEGAIDVATTSFDPLAKLAKDIAAGAVLIATVTAAAVGYLVFAERLRDPSLRVLDQLREAPFELTVIALLLTIILVIGAKAYTGRGTPLRGGLPSGHAALAFGGWMAVTYLLGDAKYWFLISTVTFVMALLVVQTRIEAGVHSVFEVFLGAMLGALVTLAIFQVFWS
jgi:diacylglycerol kinase (ATP)